MFGRSAAYRALPQSDYGAHLTLENFSYHNSSGSSFDYIPEVTEKSFTDKTQGCLSWICHQCVICIVFIFTVLTFPVSGWFLLKIVPNYERIVVFRLGRIQPPKGPGVVLVLPFIDLWQKVDLRTRAFNIPPCKVTSKDGGVISMGADIQFRIWNPVLSVVSVQDLNASTRLTAQNAMTHCLTKKTLREIQVEKIRLGEHLLVEINSKTRCWGLEVDRVELMVESVLRTPDDSFSTPMIVPPIPGLESLAGPIQQLAMHFLGGSGGNSIAPQSSQSKEDSLFIINEKDPIVPAPAKCLSADALLSTVECIFSENLVTQVGACFQFNITLQDGTKRIYFVDLTTGAGKAGLGTPDHNPDVILHMKEQDLLSLFEGHLRPFGAYTSGKLKVEGDLKIALKLEDLIKLMKLQ